MQANLFVMDDLKLLMEREGQWCVSIFMPTHRVTPRVQEDQIRFRNLLKQVEEKLTVVGADRIDQLLEPARKLLDDYPFWHHQSDGLAVFLTKDFVRPYRLPIRFEELVVVTDRFHTKPVLPLLTGDGRFYILALSQKDVRLFLCTRHSVSEVELEGVPRSLDEALRVDETEKPLQLHSHTPGGLGKKGATFHGHGVGIDDSKDRILRFFQHVDAGLQNFLAHEHAPMVIAAVDYLVPIFRQASTFPRILDKPIFGNPEEVTGAELHEKAVAIVGPYFEKDLHDYEALYQELIHTQKTASEVEEIVKAAYHGRVDVLFVPVGAHQWGEFDASADEVKVIEEEEPGSDDLLDFAAAQTLLNSGVVYAVKPEEMPEHASVAAIYRY